MGPKRKKMSVDSFQSNTDFTALKVDQLKKECQKRSLDYSGRKLDLVKRLKNYEDQAVERKKKKEDEEDTKEVSLKEKLKALAEEEKLIKKKIFQVDSHCPHYSSGKVVDDFDCMLNQTNIGANNNKFYVIQLIYARDYFVWNRWGRVGEPGQNSLKGPFDDEESAIKEFKKKFKEKTKNDWENRSNFKPASGKYTLLEMDSQNEANNAQMEEKLSNLDSVDGNTSKLIKACTLDEPTEALIQLLFNHDMFKEAMSKLNIDVKKMPLGKISKAQIAKGFEVLEEMEKTLNSKNRRNLQELTSRFYTLIPHNFGRQRPPVIDNSETLQKKMDMLTILSDIEIAQSLQIDVKKEDANEVPHPLDVNYGLLKCGLTHIDSKSDIYKIVTTYVESTKSPSQKLKLLDVWEVDRENESKRFSTHNDLTNRKLLWHGTNVAVVVAILKNGLRIMPHSGGRVGRGLYFASEHSKSAAYVGTVGDGTGIMFLNEVVLGKQHIITADDSSLIKAPNGFDSVLAKGKQEPDPKKDITIKLDSHDVIVPQGKPKPTSAKSSSFYNSEYLIYNEDQCRIRYLLKFKF